MTCKPTRWTSTLSVICCAMLAGIGVEAAQSTYSGGNNKDLDGGLIGPWNLGDRAKYGVVQLRGNQELTFDDNLYLTQPNRTNDFVSITSPGISYRLGSVKHNVIEVGYDANLIRYLDHSGEDGEEHLPFFTSVLNLGKTRVQASDKLSFVEGGSNRGSANEVTQRVRKTSNDATLSSETKIDDKLAFGLHVHHFWFNPQGSLLERREIDGGATLFYKAFAKVDLYAEVDGGNVDVRGGDNQDFAQGRVGFRGQLTPTLSGQFDIGGEHRTSSTPGVKDIDTPIMTGSLIQAWSEDLQTILSLGRRINASISTSSQRITATTAGLSTRYQFGPVLSRELKTRKLALGLDYSYENDDFDLPTGTVQQSTDIHTVAPSLEYRIQDYWKLYLVYRFQDLSTNVVGSDYSNNRVSIGTSLFF